MCSDTSRSQNTLCQYPGCSRTVWRDPDGSFSSYCGMTHREAMIQDRSVRMCKNCQVRPVYIENGRAHDFCGRRCATAYRSGQQSPASPQAPPRAHTNNNGVCKLPGCQSPAFYGQDQIPSEYCSNKHRLEAVRTGKAEACLQCWKWPKTFVNGKTSDFCSKKCSQDVIDSAPIIVNVATGQAAFRAVKQQFLDGWKHPTTKPTVMKIYKIYSDKDHSDKFSRYKLALERVRGDANSRRRWHGTQRACQLGDNEGNLGLCFKRDCSLCGIIRISWDLTDVLRSSQSSFQLAQAGRRTNFGRFGEGIYTSATSSKANDYVAELGGSPYKTVLLNDVVMGKTIKMTTGDVTLTKPPAGYDSVVGEPGGDLNYDESIVYKNEAIRPLFLVIYRS